MSTPSSPPRRVERHVFHHFPDRVSYLVALHRRFHDVLFDEVTAAIGDLAPGKDRLGVAARTYLDACLRDRGVKALLLEARGHLPIADEVTRRNRMNVDVVAADFAALGGPIPAKWRDCGSRRPRNAR